MEQLRIDYDDILPDIIDRINTFLEPHNLAFVDDMKDHDGYCLFTLVDTKSLSSGRMGEP